MMSLYVLSRVLHVLAVVVWIGGVAMVTVAVLPAIKASDDPRKGLAFFQRVEQRFKPIAQVSTVIAGVTGFYMLYLTNGWWMFTTLAYWWVHAMVCVWLIFMVLLFILEPFVVEKQLEEGVKENPERVVRNMIRIHWALLILSVVTICGTVAGAHGWLF